MSREKWDPEKAKRKPEDHPSPEKGPEELAEENELAVSQHTANAPNTAILSGNRSYHELAMMQHGDYISEKVVEKLVTLIPYLAHIPVVKSKWDNLIQLVADLLKENKQIAPGKTEEVTQKLKLYIIDNHSKAIVRDIIRETLKDVLGNIKIMKTINNKMRSREYAGN